MRKILHALTSFSFLFSLHAFGSEKLIDKIVAVINNKVISLSELQQIKSTLSARREVSPQVYNKEKPTEEELLYTSIRSFIIRDKISAQGYTITDDAVEERIKMTEERLGLRRADLLNFLKSKKISFEEYFELIREAMEYSIFASRIIAPLVSVTEQEVKNEFYKRFSSDNALSFRYNLIDFQVPLSSLVEKNQNEFIKIVKDYQLTNKVPANYRELSSFKLENMTEDKLNEQILKALKTTPEGSFSAPLEIAGSWHVFYIETKDLVESQKFLDFKEALQNEIFFIKGQTITEGWFDREYQNYFINTML